MVIAKAVDGKCVTAGGDRQYALAEAREVDVVKLKLYANAGSTEPFDELAFEPHEARDLIRAIEAVLDA